MGDHGLIRFMFSLVIPTHNRAPILKRALAHLLKLEGIEDCEIIVINDGSTDDTAAVLEEFRQAAPNMLRVLTQSNGGPACARNRGVEAAKYERILFVDDDVFPRPGLLQSHRLLLEAGYTGSQGLLLWHEDIKITPLIRYIDSRGAQFAFDRVKDAGHLDFAQVYTANFAVLRSAVLEAGGFDEEFFNKKLGFSAFEDTILGYNLVRNGAKLCLNREAIADHLHDTTEDGYLYREYKVGYAIGLLREKYPPIASSLGLQQKDFLPQSQAHMLRLLNGTRILRQALGYSLSMRLRNREAFYRGFLQFKRERASRQIPPKQ